MNRNNVLLIEMEVCKLEIAIFSFGRTNVISVSKVKFNFKLKHKAFDFSSACLAIVMCKYPKPTFMVML